MSKNFWLKLKEKRQPILALAPLAGFTDSAFRQVCKSYGADVLYSEMASATALFYNQKNISLSKNSTLKLLKFNSKKEKYYVVQLFGANPEHFAVATQLITKIIKPDGIDINFGCPVPKVVKQGAGSGLMIDLERSRAVIQAVLANTDLPVSIKIRVGAKFGAKETNAFEFLKNISDLKVAALMIHGRTLKQGFAGEPDWGMIKQAKKYFKGVILANGGINDLASAKKAIKLSGAAGLGLARGALGRPWLFKEIKTDRIIDLKPKAIFKVAISHATLEQKQKGKSGIIDLRKHLVWYLTGLVGASKLRERLVKVNNLKEIKNIFSSY